MNSILINVGLRFEAEDDEDFFLKSFNLDDLVRTQAAMILGAFVYCAFGIWDWILDPRAWVTTLFIRIAVSIIVLLPLTFMLAKSKARDYVEYIYLAYCAIPGCALSLIYLLLQDGFEHAAAGMIIVILFVSTLLPLRLLSLLAFCLSTWVCFAVCEAFAENVQPALRLLNNFEIGIAYALAFYAVGSREFRARRQFQTTQALQIEKKRTERALLELKSAQAYLVQTEKLAALGTLVAGVAHEVNTPIGLALTTSTALEADVKRLSTTIESGQVRRSELVQGIARLTEGTRLLFSSISRAADLVHNFKQVAIDQTTEERRTFDVRVWLLELMSTLSPLLRRKGHDVHIMCEPGIVLNSYPGALAQVISNLALNAAVHAYPDGRAGSLKLTVSRMEGDRLQIVFEDDGVGISPDSLGKVFDPFFTTRRDQGSTGLGLHVVFNLVVSTLDGEIDLKSLPDEGTQFTISLPCTLDIDRKSKVT